MIISSSVAMRHTVDHHQRSAKLINLQVDNCAKKNNKILWLVPKLHIILLHFDLVLLQSLVPPAPAAFFSSSVPITWWKVVFPTIPLGIPISYFCNVAFPQQILECNTGCIISNNQPLIWSQMISQSSAPMVLVYSNSWWS